MKKIVFACDGDNYSPAALDFIGMMRETENISVTGFFFSPVNYGTFAAASLSGVPEAIDDLLHEEEDQVQKSISQFRRQCRENDISFTVGKEPAGPSYNPLIEETRFADLLVISEKLFYRDIDPEQPNVYMQDVLHLSKCPVILIPESWRATDTILIAYDGSDESIYAMKMFCNLFPALAEKRVKVIHFEHRHGASMPDMPQLEEYAGAHFPDLVYETIHENGRKHLTEWAEQSENAMVVCGAFGRSQLSVFLRRSFIDRLIHANKVPVFIAHPYN